MSRSLTQYDVDASRLSQILDLFAEGRWRMFIEVNSKVRPPRAPSSAPRSETYFGLVREASHARKRRARHPDNGAAHACAWKGSKRFSGVGRIALADAMRYRSATRCRACALRLHD